MNRLLIVVILLIGFTTIDSKPVDDGSAYKIEFAEFGVGTMTIDCNVVFNQDSVYIILPDSSFLGNIGDTIEAGILARHKSGMMIIQHNETDIYEEEVGGCTGGPSVLDTVEKIYWMC
ncbi:MAG: hypothetical protein WC121_12060 [Candidatus Kapaibacterium sp.]